VDCVFNPGTYELGKQSEQFLKALIQTAIEGVERQYNLKLEKSKYHFPDVSG
jgi:dynein assembly factor 2